MTPREFWIAFALGIAFAAPPGIVTAESLRRGLAGGFWRAALVGFGSLIGDAVYAILALTGLARLFQYVAAQRIVAITGAGVLLFLAWSALRSNSLPEASASTSRGAFTAGALLSLTNPFAITFWVGFGGALLASGVQDPARDMASLLAVFLGASALWVFILSGLIAAGRKFVGRRLFRTVSIASAATFAATALYTVWRTFV
jgi:threonine/homoserine/homoserine lactone efflux protein